MQRIERNSILILCVKQTAGGNGCQFKPSTTPSIIKHLLKKAVLHLVDQLSSKIVLPFISLIRQALLFK